MVGEKEKNFRKIFKSCSSKWKQQLLVNKPNMKLSLSGGKPNFIKSDFRCAFFFKLLRDYESSHTLSVDAANKQMCMRDCPSPTSAACVSDKVRGTDLVPAHRGEDQS